MAGKEKTKDFNAKMRDSKDMPKVEIVDDPRSVAINGGEKMLLAPPLEYDVLMKKPKKGQLITVGQMREHLAYQHQADFTCPLTAGIFVNICAWAAYQRKDDVTPWWRTLKSDGELNPKYPEAVDLQIRLLEEEGHEVYTKGRTNLRYYVKDFEKKLVSL